VAGEIVINATNTDILKVRFTLRATIDDTVISGPTVINRVGNSITATAIGLTPETNYRWEYELYALINGVFVISSDPSHIGSICATNFSTLATVDCPAPESLIVTKNS
jgi:hypothetical protein